MLDFLYKSPVFAAVIYVFALIVMAAYVFFKWKQKRLFTICNISIYILAFTYFVTGPFQFQDRAWKAFGQTSAVPFYPYLYKSIIINFIGLIVFLLSEMYFEKRNMGRLEKRFIGQRFCNVIEHNYVYQINIIIFCAVTALWLFIVFKYNDGLPLFNQGRAFFYDTGMLSFIYQSLTIIVGLYGLYWGLYYADRRKGLVFFILAAFVSIATGTRKQFFVQILYPFLILIFYKKYKSFSGSKALKLLPFLAGLMVFGIYITYVRSGKTTNLDDTINNIFYGSTFCDIRDGAYILYGYENNLNNEFIGGKTFLAGILSFVPSYLSPFRVEWSFGRYTTHRMFHITSAHFGFRGGDALEPYLNFGLLGVVILFIVSGYFFANAEIVCEDKLWSKLHNGEAISVNSIIYVQIVSALAQFAAHSGNIRDIYVYLILLCSAIILRNLLPMKKAGRRYLIKWR